MRIIKILLSMMLCVCMLASLVPSVFAAETVTFESTPVINYSKTALTAGEIKATVTATPTNGTATLMLAMMLYKNNKLIDAAGETKTVTSSDKTLTATMNISTVEAGMELKTVLWNNIDSMKPLCAASIFPDGGNELRKLTVDGAEVSGFTPEKTQYTYVVANDATAKPELTFDTMDGGAKTVWQGNKSFPGKTEVKVTAAKGGEPKTYTVNYKTAEDLTKNCALANESDGSQVVAYALGKNFNAGDGGSLNAAAGTREFGSKVISDRNQPANATTGYANEVREIPAKYSHLVGCDYMMDIAGNSAITVHQESQGVRREFTLYRDATVYVFSNWGTATDGWDFVSESSGVKVRVDTEQNLAKVSSKHFDVTDTVNGLKVEVPTSTAYAVKSDGSKQSHISLIVIDYDGYETMSDKETDTSAPSGGSGDGGGTTQPPVVEKSGADSLVYKKNDVKQNIMINGTTTPPDVCRAEEGNGLAIGSASTTGSRIVPNRAYPVNTTYRNQVEGLHSDYSFLIGKDYVMSTLGDWSERAENGYETSFKIYQDTTVYMFVAYVNKDIAEANGWTVRNVGNAMTLQMNATYTMSYVLTQKFTTSDKVNGLEVVLTKEMLAPASGSSYVNLTVLDYTNQPVPGSAN